MVHEWPKQLDNLLSLPMDRQIQRCVAMFYGTGSPDPARAVVMLIYLVSHAERSNIMPRGRRWRGGGGDAPCPRHVYRFVEPCLLLLLHRDRTHGYDLMEGLKEFGFAENPVDSSVVYRTLRAMEAAGLVASTWDTTGTGPPRRVYRITAEGDRYLAQWVADLRETDRVLHGFLDAYDEHIREGVGEHH